MSTVGLSLIGLMVLGIAFSGSALDVGYWLAKLFIPNLQSTGTRAGDGDADPDG